MVRSLLKRLNWAAFFILALVCHTVVCCALKFGVTDRSGRWQTRTPRTGSSHKFYQVHDGLAPGRNRGLASRARTTYQDKPSRAESQSSPEPSQPRAIPEPIRGRQSRVVPSPSKARASPELSPKQRGKPSFEPIILGRNYFFSL